MIRVEKLTVSVGSFQINDICMELQTGEYGVLMGKTGCGKTTLLESIAGLKPVSAGRIVLDGIDVTNLRPAERGIGYLPQDGALFSTMTVHDNIAFALSIKKRAKSFVEQRVKELAGLLGVEALLHRMPHGLSGGEKQRVALGRALAASPGILCLDEPLSALDQDTRQEMYELLRRVQSETRVTVLHVTHNTEEVNELADRLFVIKDGQYQESGSFESRKSTTADVAV